MQKSGWLFLGLCLLLSACDLTPEDGTESFEFTAEEGANAIEAMIQELEDMASKTEDMSRTGVASCSGNILALPVTANEAIEAMQQRLLHLAAGTPARLYRSKTAGQSVWLRCGTTDNGALLTITVTESSTIGEYTPVTTDITFGRLATAKPKSVASFGCYAP